MARDVKKVYFPMVEVPSHMRSLGAIIERAHKSAAAGEVVGPVSYTHLRAHETPEHLVCRLLLEKKKNKKN